MYVSVNFTKKLMIYKTHSLPQTEVALPSEESEKVSQATAERPPRIKLDILRALIESIPPRKSGSHFWCFLYFVTIVMICFLSV